MKWDKDSDKKYEEEVVELQRGKQSEYQWPKKEAGDHKKKWVNGTDGNGDVVQLPTVLQTAQDVLDKRCMLLHLSLTVYTGMGYPIYKFILGIQVDVVPKGGTDGERRPVAHRVYT